MDINHFLSTLGETALYGLESLILVVIGYVVLDLLTPGKLSVELCEKKNHSLGFVTSAGLLSLGIIIFRALYGEGYSLGEGLATAGALGILGLALMSLSFVVIDLLTPGKLGDLLVDDEVTDKVPPIVWVTSSALFAVALGIAAAIPSAT